MNRRRLASLAAAALLAGSVGLAAPAQAAAGPCAGSGTMELSGLLPSDAVDFEITIDCVNGGSISAFGWLGGPNCDNWVGGGVLATADGYFDIGITAVNSAVSISGDAIGAGRVTSNPVSCATATEFLFTGVVTW